MPYLALILLFFNRIIASALAFLAAAFVSPTPITLSEALEFASKEWDMLLAWVNAHLPLTTLLGVSLLLFLAAELTGPGFYASLKTIAPIVALILGPLVFQIYPLPLNNANNYYSNLIRQPWLPAVRITRYSGRPMIGYTLSTNDKWFIILLADDRKIRYIHADNVAKQRICQIGESQANVPLLTLIPTTPTLPMCEIARSPHVVTRHGNPNTRLVADVPVAYAAETAIDGAFLAGIDTRPKLGRRVSLLDQRPQP